MESERSDDPWCLYIPHLHRALADPAQIGYLPYVAEELTLEHACAAWEPLHYLFTALLGWQSPGHGLAWWYAAGKPVDDPRLRVVRDHWNARYQLDYYAAWAWAQGQVCLAPDDLDPAAMARASLWQNEDWWRAFKRRGRALQNDPFYGGSNPLHLGHSETFGWLETSGANADLLVDKARRKAVLLVSGLQSWRADLEAAEARMPSLGDRSWHVEVIDRQVGWLGEYRQSRETDRWFLGRHSLHVKGNSQNASNQ